MNMTILINDKEFLSLGRRNKVDKKEAYSYMKKGNYLAIDVARHTLSHVNSLGNKITNLKLQKILYYIQAHSLKQTNEPLFSNPIEAWRHGPVVRSVYNYYREYTNRPITELEAPWDSFDEQEKRLMNDIVEKFVDLDEWELVRKTHKEAPWKNVYEKGSNNEISLKSIKDYFTNRNII